jgi:hypothetical protein
MDPASHATVRVDTDALYRSHPNGYAPVGIGVADPALGIAG